MVPRCVNPGCEAKKDFFGAGALYAFARAKSLSNNQQMQCFWLCADCADRFAVQVEATGTPSVIARANRDRPSNSARKAKLVFRSTRVTLPTAKLRSHLAG
jgi:hypothetical protein